MRFVIWILSTGHFVWYLSVLSLLYSPSSLIRVVYATSPLFMHAICLGSQRIGCGKDGLKQIKAHRWFRNMSWENLEQMKLKTPWTPDISDGLDASYYEIALEGSEMEQDHVDPFEGDQQLFADF